MKNYKKNTVVLFSGLILMALIFMLSACSGVRVIPEVSYSLSDEDVLDLTYKKIAKKIIKNKSEFVFITLMGEIFRWNPGEKIVDFLYNLNTTIDPEVFNQGNYVVLKKFESGAYMIFDLNEMKETGLLENIKIEKIVAVDREHIVYLANTNELTFFNYRSKTPLKTLELDDKRVYNSAFKDNKILILSGSSLIIYSKGGNSVRILKLKHKAGSGFLLDGRWIYYGSDKRELIKFSTTSGKTRWRFKIARTLKITPLKIGPYISVIPGDNNIYFFNKNGTLYWWEKLDSALLLPPESMKENIVVLLWNKKIKFFNYKKKRVITYPLNRVVKSNPVNIGEYIYLVLQDDISEKSEEDGKPPYTRLSKLGNHYGVNIKTDPEYIKPMGKSVTFYINSINLIDPQYKIKIFNNSRQHGDGENGPVVFDKIITKKDKPYFIWIPKEAVEYRIVVDVNAVNKRNLKLEETFRAVDIDKILQNYYYQLQTQYDTHSLE